MKIYCDDKTIINIAHNPIKHDQIKHIKVDKHFIKKRIKNGMISTPFVTAKQQLVNIFIERISSIMFDYIVGKLRMHDIHALA